MACVTVPVSAELVARPVFFVDEKCARVYECISVFQRRYRLACPSVPRIAWETRLSRRSVQRALRWLCEFRFLEQRPRAEALPVSKRYDRCPFVYRVVEVMRKQIERLICRVRSAVVDCFRSRGVRMTPYPKNLVSKTSESVVAVDRSRFEDRRLPPQEAAQHVFALRALLRGS